jgi:phospholipid-binding lipoprotein MlaA
MHINKNIKLGTCGRTFALLFLLSSVYNANADVFIPFEQTIADQYNMPSSSAQEVEEVTEPVAVVSFEQTIADQYNMPSSSAQEVEEVTEPVAVVSFEQTIEDQYNSPYAVTEIVEEDASEEAFDYSLYDPNEEENRKSFEFHQKLDKNLFKPLAKAYRDVVPEGGRKAIKNFLHNLETPTVLINDVLQGEQERAGTTVNRFVINSTVGFLGFGDPATDLGYERHTEDFAQTLAVYGVESGPYSYSPIFGPTTVRHTTGRVVDFLTHPLTWYFSDQDVSIGLTYGATRVVSTREDLLDALDDIEMDSTDYYVSIRSMYRQMRENQINNGLFGDDPSQFSIDTGIDLNLVF